MIAAAPMPMTARRPMRALGVSTKAAAPAAMPKIARPTRRTGEARQGHVESAHGAHHGHEREAHDEQHEAGAARREHPGARHSAVRLGGRTGPLLAHGRDATPAGIVAGMSDKSGSRAARGAWVASGITFFMVGVVFSLTMPENFALGITFLALGVVFFSLSATQRAPGDGPGEADDAEPAPDGDDTPGDDGQRARDS